MKGKTTKIIISKNTYDFLKRVGPITEEQKKMIRDYEEEIGKKEKEKKKNTEQEKKQNIIVLSTSEIKKKFFFTAVEYHKPKKFIINEENRDIYKFFYHYIIRKDLPNITENTPPLVEKGIMLAGNPGSGKTSLFEIMKKTQVKPASSFWLMSAHEIVIEYNREGSIIYDRYRKQNLLIDDIGSEETGNYYGTRDDVIRVLLELRYIDWKKNGLITHLTTNLTMSELEQRYGLRIVSRLREMCNILYLGATPNSIDYRK